MAMMLMLTWSKTHHQLRVRLATLRQRKTQPFSLSHRGLLLTMELAGTHLQMTPPEQDPTNLGSHLQVSLPHLRDVLQFAVRENSCGCHKQTQHSLVVPTYSDNA